MDQQEPFKRATAVLQSHRQALLAKANVVGVGVGLRQKGGQVVQSVVLVVMVNRKIPAHHLDPKDLIPSEIEGVQVDVQETGELVANSK